MNLEPNDMVRMWHAAAAMRQVLMVGTWATVIAVSVVLQDDLGDRLGPWLDRKVSRALSWQNPLLRGPVRALEISGTESEREAMRAAQRTPSTPAQGFAE